MPCYQEFDLSQNKQREDVAEGVLCSSNGKLLQAGFSKLLHVMPGPRRLSCTPFGRPGQSDTEKRRPLRRFGTPVPGYSMHWHGGVELVIT